MRRERRIERRQQACLLGAHGLRGWRLQQTSLGEVSGIHGSRVTPQGLEGGADPRREGIVGRIPAPQPAATPAS